MGITAARNPSTINTIRALQQFVANAPTGYKAEISDGRILRYVSQYLDSRQNCGLEERPGLYLPRLVTGDHLDIREGNFPVYAKEEDGALTYYNGLNEYVMTLGSATSPRSYFIDNHSVGAFALAEAVSHGALEPGFTVLQVDFHEDAGGHSPTSVYLRDPKRITSQDLKGIAKDLKRTHIASHNDLILCSRLASEVLAVGHQGEFLASSIKGEQVLGLAEKRTQLLRLTPPMGGYIMQKDYPKKPTSIAEIISRNIPRNKLAIQVCLDAFLLNYDERGITDSETVDLIVRFLREIARAAGVLVIITSPGFTYHDVAVRVAKEVSALTP